MAEFNARTQLQYDICIAGGVPPYTYTLEGALPQGPIGTMATFFTNIPTSPDIS